VMQRCLPTSEQGLYQNHICHLRRWRSWTA
jgi:hypothetical protein